MLDRYQLCIKYVPRKEIVRSNFLKLTTPKSKGCRTNYDSMPIKSKYILNDAVRKKKKKLKKTISISPLTELRSLKIEIYLDISCKHIYDLKSTFRIDSFILNQNFHYSNSL